MATSDSEDFESADENFETNASSTKIKKRHSKEVCSPVSGADNEGTCKQQADVEAVDNRLNSSSGAEGEKHSNIAIDEDKVFDMFDDKTSNAERRRKLSEEKKARANKEPRQKLGVKRLGTKVGDVSAQSTNVPSKTNIETVDSECKKVIGSKVTENSDAIEKPGSTDADKSTREKAESKADDGWDLEDGFEIPASLDGSKPKHEEFEKELFPVLDKLSGLSMAAKKETKETDEKHQGGAAGGWGGWSSWGVGSFISNATESVSTLTSHVSAGINTVLETSLGAPDPLLLAEALEKERLEKEKAKTDDAAKGNSEKPEEDSAENDGKTGTAATGLGGFGQLMSGVSQLGTKVISGGLDTLETLGKKTMEVLQEGDPGLRKKRAMFFQDDDKPVLSQILREAKENAEHSNKLDEEKQAAKKVHLESLFDDYQGLVHLEALEMLSKQCQLKLQSILLSLTGDALTDLQETLEQVRDLCELPDEEDDDEREDEDKDFAKKVADAITTLAIDVRHSRIAEVSKAVEEWLRSDEAKGCKPVEVHRKAVASMAEFTSVTMEMFHRAGELLLIKPHHSTADEAESLTQLTTILCGHVSRMATKFTMLLTDNGEPNDDNNKVITTIFMESAECSSYIQDACRLLVPVLQLGAAS